MQTNNAAASNVIYKQKIRGETAVAQKTIKEGSTPSGSIFTTISAKGFTTTGGDKLLCVTVTKADPDESDTVFQGCGPAQQLTIANGLGSATFGGTVTGFDYVADEEKTVTVKAELTATGKIKTSPFNVHTSNRDITEVLHTNGEIRSASGSLNIEGGITLSVDDAVGIISKHVFGTIQVTKN